METRVGEEGLGVFAREQIDAARNDPRLDRGRGAMVADFWVAMEEAERTRKLGILGLEELTRTLERYEHEQGVARDDDELSPRARATLQAYWERAESARIEIANGCPHLNAQALISMNSALDAMVEEWVPAMRAIRAMAISEHLMQRAEQEHPDLASKLTDEQREALSNALPTVVTEQLPKLVHMTGSGAARYEALLCQEGLGAPPDRPLPADLDRALAELGAIRDVLVHRAGRVDVRALEQAPSLRYKDGDLVRVTRHEYREYSAAVRCYAAELAFRSFRSWPEVTDEKDGPDLAGWRNYVMVLA
jgi:hypothetical protein